MIDKVQGVEQGVITVECQVEGWQKMMTNYLTILRKIWASMMIDLKSLLIGFKSKNLLHKTQIQQELIPMISMMHLLLFLNFR